jgi:hypothetical protein
MDRLVKHAEARIFSSCITHVDLTVDAGRNQL